MDLKVGHTYKHFKGGMYKIIGFGKHTETQEELVIYEGVEGDIWARPKKMFLETVEVGGQDIPRFLLQK